jgi:hypothetical protein
LTTIESLEKREGHILNWYETTTRRPLDPRYVSTVDSGNLAAYLWTVRMACTEAADSPLVGASVIDAAIDNLELLAIEIAASSGRTPAKLAERSALGAMLATARDSLGKDWGSTFTTLAALTAAAEAIGATIPEPRARGPRYGVGSWGELTRRGLTSWLDEIRALAPFAESLASVPEALSTGDLEPTWTELVQGLSAAWSATALAEATSVALTRLGPIERSLRGALGPSDPARDAGLHFLTELRSRLVLSQGACSALQIELMKLGARASRHRRRHELQVPLRRGARPLLDWLQRRRGASRPRSRRPRPRGRSSSGQSP